MHRLLVVCNSGVDPMTPADLAKLESLAREATPGPWHEFGLSVVSCDVPQDVDHKIYRGFNKPDYDGKFLLCESVVHEPTLAYIAAANPAAVLALIERVRKLEVDAARFCIGDLSKVEGDGT